jgi:hypothetical protein
VQTIKDNDADEILTKGHNHSISAALVTTAEVSEKLNFTDSKRRLALLKQHLSFVGRNASEVYTDLHGVFRSFMEELCLIYFVHVPADKLKYFEQQDASGDLYKGNILFNFPEAWNDIVGAGNSLAFDLYDAAAFYLMRVVETGLRDLARNQNVVIPKTPLDYAGWKAVVKAIDDKLTKKIPKARGIRQTEALKFKHDLLVDFRAFEVIRNEIMHGRSHYNEQEAIGLFNRVGEFMQRLAQSYAKQTKSRKRKSV